MFHMDDVTYGQRLREARKRDGRFRTQEALGDAIGRSGRQVRNYERGRNLNPETKALLEAELGDFAPDGDPVEVAIDHSALTTSRKLRVKSEYHAQLEAQQREEAAG